MVEVGSVAMNAQVNTQLQPPTLRRIGLGAVNNQSLSPNAGDRMVTQPADAGSILSVTVPSEGNVVTATWTGGISNSIPLSCPDPCQFVLDGTYGVLTLTWGTLGTPAQILIDIVGAPVAPPPASQAPPSPPVYSPPGTLPKTPIAPILHPITPINLNSPTGGVRATGPATSPTSTGTKVAIGAAAVAGTSLLTVMVISAVTGWGISKTLDIGWDKLTGKKSKKK
jgi:hypothetical protein